MTSLGTRPRPTADAVARVLRELEVLHAEAQRPTPDWHGCRERVAHPDMLGVLQKLIDSASFLDAALECISSPTGVLAAVFFGPMAEAVEIDAASATVHATDGSRRLCVTLAAPGTDIQTIVPHVTSVEGSPPTSTVTVATDCNRYHFTHSTTARRAVEPFLEVDIGELAADVALVGSVWSSVFPAHRAILTRTVAVSVPRRERGILFNHRKGAPWIDREVRREIRALDRLTSAFGSGDGLRLLSLEDLRQRLEASGQAAETLAERRTGNLVVRTHRPPRSTVVRFDPTSPAREPKRGDYVLSYQPGGSGAEFYREFVMSVEDWKPEEHELYRATLDILHVLAIRRSGLFRLGFAERVYTVLLPPTLLRMEGRGDQGMFLVPCVILYQVPRKSSFRRTFTVSYVAIPVDLDAVAAGEDDVPVLSRIKGPRVTAIDDLRALRRYMNAQVVPDHGSVQSPHVRAYGPLAELLGVEGDCLALPTLFQQIGEFICGRVIARGRKDASSIAAAMTLTATVDSTLSTLLLQVDWCPPSGAAQPWEDWLITGKDRPFTDNVYKLMFYEDFIEPRSGYTSRRGIDFARMLVGNNLRTDMNGMSFFDPTDELKLILYPLHRELYPNYSIVRWMAFSLYSESALCSLQGMIQRFYIDLHRQNDLRRVVETLGEMTESFAELYDLDIRRYLYRQEYERLRELLKVDRDYAFLLEKFGAVKEDASLREQRLFNKLLVAFVVATTSVAVIGTIAQILQWTPVRVLAVTIPTAVALTVASYVTFDRIRRLLTPGR